MKGFRNNLGSLALGVSLIASTSRPYSEDNDKNDDVFVQGRGFIPKRLHDLGLHNIDEDLAQPIQSLYFLVQNHNSGRVIAKQGTPRGVALRVSSGQIVNENNTTYDNNNVWRSAEESREVYEDLMRERLGQISNSQYDSLPQPIQEIVDKAKALV